MEPCAVFFDLDGTLTDSGPGIMNCARYALEHYGIPIPNPQALRFFVGPPLRESFRKFGIPQEQMEEAVTFFRSRYQTVGKFENAPYDGIRETLCTLQSRGLPLYVATSKPETMAVEILEKFDLARYFRAICGATMDGSRDSKSAVIAWLLESIGPVAQAVMVGDTAFDVTGARAHGIPTIGVTWGYGSGESLTAAGAVALAHTPEELLSLLLEKDSTFALDKFPDVC